MPVIASLQVTGDNKAAPMATCGKMAEGDVTAGFSG